MQQTLRSSVIQAKLSISEPEDEYEMEADRVADHVMRMQEPPGHNTDGLSGHNSGLSIQRLCKECDEQVQRQEGEEEDEQVIQAKEAPGQSPSVPDGLEYKIRSLSGGHPLGESERSFFEPRFGYDFSGVRIHNNSQASSLARSINALAFTVGQNVVFGDGQYKPNSPEGKKLLAHELTHVVQQNDLVKPKRAAHKETGSSSDIKKRVTVPKVQRRLVAFGTLADVNALLGLLGPRAGLTSQIKRSR